MVATSQFDVEPLSFGRRNVHSTISWAQSQMSFNGRDNVKPTANSRRWQKERETFEGVFLGVAQLLPFLICLAFHLFFVFVLNQSISIASSSPLFFFFSILAQILFPIFFSFESLFIDVVFVSLSLPLSLRSRVDVTGYLRVEPEPARDHCVLRGGMGDWWSVCVCVCVYGGRDFFFAGRDVVRIFLFLPFTLSSAKEDWPIIMLHLKR